METDDKAVEEEEVVQLTWGLDPAHFYIASVVFCLAAFTGYLVSITIMVARANPHRMTCLRVAGALLGFEVAIIVGGCACPFRPAPWTHQGLPQRGSATS